MVVYMLCNQFLVQFIEQRQFSGFGFFYVLPVIRLFCISMKFYFDAQEGYKSS